jgi:nucleotide-binding universal stress UspA family protein
MVMLPIKKIVCPTDFSEPSYQGLKVAREFAEHFSAKLILVNVIFPGPIIPGVAEPGFHIPAALESMQETAEKALKELARQKMLDNISVQTLVINGKPAYEIANLADKENADIIVIATHGESGWQKFLFGSVTEKVMRMASCPVLTIQQPEEEDDRQAPEKIKKSGAEIATTDAQDPGIDACQKAPEWAEHARLEDTDQPCDDGRSGKI